MAKLIKPHRFRAILFADGPRGSYMQEWQSQLYPSLFVRVHGNKRGDERNVKQIFVKRRDLEVESFDSIEKALPTAKQHNWNPYERSTSPNTRRKNIPNERVLVLDRRKKRKTDPDLSADVKNRSGEKAGRNLALRERTRTRSKR